MDVIKNVVTAKLDLLRWASPFCPTSGNMIRFWAVAELRDTIHCLLYVILRWSANRYRWSWVVRQSSDMMELFMRSNAPYLNRQLVVVGG